MPKKQHPPAVRNSAPRKAPAAVNVNQAETEIDRAVERVYRVYGPDLSVFLAAVQNQQNLERREKREQTK